MSILWEGPNKYYDRQVHKKLNCNSPQQRKIISMANSIALRRTYTCRIHMQKLIFVALEKVKADLNYTMTLGIASRVFSQSNYHPLRTWSLPIWCEGTVGLPQTQHLQVLCRSNPRGASLFLCPKKFHSLGHVKPVIPYVFRSPKRRAISPYTTSIHP